ncbi:hypothetical protein C8Q75DRAFT_316742 [Abortiporus biennis]|nr:hypothetical protein C8Q75DRAFT_316742 [Abortiporus biennis]
MSPHLFSSPPPSPLMHCEPLALNLATFPLSSSRDEPYTPSPSSSPRYDPLNLLPPASVIPSLHRGHDNRPFSIKEILPGSGILEDGRITVHHPFVSIYLKEVFKAPNYRLLEQQTDKSFWGEKERRRLEARTVSETIGLEDGEHLNALQSECIFVLAALKVYFHPMHPAHWTFWDDTKRLTTSARVEKILGMRPCPIASPVNWMSQHQNIFLLLSIQTSCFPPEGKTAGGKNLRKQPKKGSVEQELPPEVLAPLPRARRTRAKASRAALIEQPSPGPSRFSARLASGSPSSTPNVTPSVLPSEDLPRTPEQQTPSPLTTTSPLTEDSLDLLAHVVSTLPELPIPSSMAMNSPKESSSSMSPSLSTPPYLASTLPESEVRVRTTTRGGTRSQTAKSTKRARSNSSVKSSDSCLSGSSTAVSEGQNTSGGETAVEEEDNDDEISTPSTPLTTAATRKRKGKGKIAMVEEEDGEKENTVSSRASRGKKRKLDEVVVVVEEKEQADVKDTEEEADGEDEKKVTKKPRTSGRQRKPTAAAKASATTKIKTPRSRARGRTAQVSA